MAKTGRKSEYLAVYAERLLGFADNPVSLMVRGKLSDTKVASLCDVSRETVRKWRTPVPGREEEYKADFAAAYDKCQLAIDTGAIKRGVIDKAKGYTQVKRVKEMINVGPQIPGLSGMGKDAMIAAAETVLGLELDPDRSSSYIEGVIKAELEKQKKLKLTVVKEEKTTMASDVPAAKLALNNLDKGPDAWDTKEKIENNVTGLEGLVALTREIDGSGVRPTSEDEDV